MASIGAKDPQDIGLWLEGHGLAKYAGLFSDNRIDFDIVSELQEADLEKLGIPLGDRKRLLKLITALPAHQPTPTAPQPQDSGLRQAPSSDAQRRQLTVMFCDLVGSTALSRRLDPENLREIVAAYQQLSAGIVAQLGGFVAQYLGDGILVYFGWPRAHENDAERAVRAALDIAAAMQGPDAPSAAGEPLSVRIGIATGPVVVGEHMGSGAGAGATATGETPNLAARLQELAPANGIVIAPSTHALIGALFECVALGERKFKGFSVSLKIWQVTGERQAESRFEAVRPEQLVPFVGREHEIALVLDRWRDAKAGEGQVVLLTGEAGIGKSRIAQTLRESIAAEHHVRLRYQCSFHHTSTAFYPFISQLRRAAGFALGDTDEIKLGKIEALIATTSAEGNAVVPLLAALLSVPSGDRYPPLDKPPPRIRELTIAGISDLLIGVAARQPVLLVFEDAHWTDPTSLEVIGQIVGLVARSKVLLLVTARPEFEQDWSQYAHVTRLALNRLNRAQSSALVEGVTSGKALPREVLDQIIAKTDGVPLFVEELTRMVLESGLLTESGDHFQLAGPLPPLAIPTTLQDSLMARLDRLDAVKSLAQIGAAIGREFPHKLLAAVSPLRDVLLEDALNRLVASGLVFRHGSGETARYVFKHALVQDTAYSSLLKSSRQALHQHIAAALIENYPETADTSPEILARHYAEAGLTRQAIDYCQKAGELAGRRSGIAEAIAHYSKALEILATLPMSETRDVQELNLRTGLMPLFVAGKGMAAPETEENVVRAASLVKDHDDISKQLPILYTQLVVKAGKGEAVEALLVGERIAELATSQDNEFALMTGRRLTGIAKLWLGRFAESREELERSDALYDETRHAALRFSYGGVDFRASNYSYRSIAEKIHGYPETAARSVRRALDLARSLDHVSSLAYCLMITAMPSNLHANELLETQGSELLELASRYDLRQAAASARIFLGIAQARSGRYAEGLALFDEGRRLLEETRFKVMLTGALAAVAECHCDAGNAMAGFDVVSEAMRMSDNGGECFFEADLLRVKGRLLHLSGRDTDSEDSFCQALDVARAQEAKLFEVRAGRDLASLWGKQGKCNEARDLLAPIFNSFTEGVETADLKSAKALLDTL